MACYRACCHLARELRGAGFETLIVWGANDKVFPADGAYAYLRDLSEFHLLDTGHFALATPPRRKSASCWTACAASTALPNSAGAKASPKAVSITQSFNTTSSMGRLTLNVLLSFAQFEREDLWNVGRCEMLSKKGCVTG